MPYLLSARLADNADMSRYPFNLAAVRAVSDITFGDVTVLVGDNGAGKSTLVEALAIVAGFNAEGGGRNLRFETYATHSDLSDNLWLQWHHRPIWGWFLRAETFYGMASHIHTDDDPLTGLRHIFPDLHNRSHGESFLSLIDSRMAHDGLYILDEPESALSFHGQLKLMRTMHDVVSGGGQFILATHSPLLMAFPGARVYELTDDGARPIAYDDLDVVSLWRNFLDSPERFFRHLFAEPTE